MAIEPCQGDEDEKQRKESKRMTNPRAGDSGQGGSGAGEGEKDSDKKFFRKTESRSCDAPRAVNGGEINKCGGRENRVALACSVWHGANHKPQGNGGGCNR